MSLKKEAHDHKCYVTWSSSLVAAVIFISDMGTVTHRVHCTESLVCTGAGNQVFWTFLGGGANPIRNSTSRRQIITQETVNGMLRTTATLLFDPVIPRFPESYVCQILGDDPVGVNVRVMTIDSE